MSVYTASTGETWIDPIAENVDGTGVFISPNDMECDRPYPYRLGGQWLVAIKRSGGAIDIYTFQPSLRERVANWLRR